MLVQERDAQAERIECYGTYVLLSNVANNRDDFLENSPSSCRAADSHLVRDSSGVSTVFCLLSSSMRVTVTSFSLSFDSVVAIGGVTPKYLPRMTCMNNNNRGVMLAAVSHPFSIDIIVQE